MARHELLGGLIQVYRRNGRHWHCSASIDGRQYRSTTREDDLVLAKQFAEDWYLGLRGKAKAGLLKKNEKTFKQAAEQFLKEYEVITEGHRSKRWIEGYGIRLRLHLLPFFGDMGLSEITPGKAQEYRVHRISTSRTGKAPARSTIHDEIVTLRQVLKTAIRHEWLAHLPDFSPPYKSQGKVVHRPWFSPEEYKQLYTMTREHAKSSLPHHRWNAEQLHDYVLFLGNTGLRPDEAKNLQHRDITIVEEGRKGDRILEIEVRGKRGVGYCKSTPSAVLPYERLLTRPKYVPQGKARERKKNLRPVLPPQYPQPTDPVFPGNHIKLFNRLLDRSNLKLDRDGKPRTAYSLRHTYICMRLMEGADIYQIAKNCRTSVEMIEKFYAAHIKNTLDAAAINVRRPKSVRQVKPAPSGGTEILINPSLSKL
ncbi:tyrosine-type recombinase/integrase [Bradyrhizobium glycinis]|uniref:tyrosine-type recombinase/integrase n=1 Tax=Bradyrhizobium glycinis TaxID=2751812 RepID=UPI001FEAA367|nr:site-specific integrase [Bradyrhizobium glycinis]MBH5373371.1 site-specific integrase [Bradyrhizobium glycinis]